VSTSLIDKIKMFSKYIKNFKFIPLFTCSLLYVQIYLAFYIVYISDQHFITLKENTKQVLIDLLAFLFINDMDVILGDFYIKFFIRSS
jgi:hypothetical protein